MSCDVRIDSRGLGIIEIPDADGEMREYRVRLMPRGLSLWAIQFARIDSGNEYVTRVFKDSRGERWECSCPSHTYRKRGAPPCKHCQAGAALRAWLLSFTEPTTEIHHERTAEAV